MDGRPDEWDHGHGCLTMGVRLAALGVLGPFVAIRRWWWTRRRGAGVRTVVTEEGGRPGGGLGRLDWTVDVPLEEERAARRRVTGAIVRIAESIGSPGDIYHVVSRSPVESETDLRAIGPMLQALGDRLHTFLGREVLQGRTSVWPVLPRGVHLAEYVEAVRYDPDAPGEPGGLLAELPCRWAFAVAWRRERASVIYRVALWVPTEVAATVRAVLESS